jgi:hypothetical protein
LDCSSFAFPLAEVGNALAGNARVVPEEEVQVRDVKALKTRAGNTRFVVRDERGREFSTFKEDIARGLPELQGKRARIRYHEEQRGGYTNVYLDGVEPLDAGGDDTDASESAWRTAVEAAPYLLSEEEKKGEVPPEELFERLRPFKELVEEDIEDESAS